MGLCEVCLEAFSTWLVAHADDIVGCPKSCFDSPLARWLSEVTGHVYGVDGALYGRASWEYCRWRSLPRWAEVFSAWLEARPAWTVTGEQAFAVLAAVELALSGAAVVAGRADVGRDRA